MNGLKLLPIDVQSYLRSGVAVSSLSQCAEELTLNGIDAKATCIAVRVDTSLCRVQVVDNGHGIDKEQLQNIAIRYSTSKCHSVQDMEQLRFHGYRGEALASIRDLCAILEIESCAKGTGMTYRRAFQGTDGSAVVEAKRPRACVGTTITVHNLFHNLPVRRKHLDESLEFEKVKRMLEAIALIHPKCSFSLRNEMTGKVVLKTQKCDSLQGAFTHLFGLDKSRHLVEVEVEQKPFKFKGYISTEAHTNKQLQYVYINGRLVLKSKIHKVTSWILQKRSAICRRKGKYVVGRDYSPNSSPPKQPDRHGIYVLNLECPLNEYDITFDPSKTLVEFKNWIAVMKLLKDVVYNFLRHNNLLAQEDTYKGNWNDGCTFADSDLKAVLEGDDVDTDSPRSLVNSSPSGSSPSTTSGPTTSYGLESTVFSLQSKTVKRVNLCSNSDSNLGPQTATASTAVTATREAAANNDEQSTDNNIASFDTVILNKGLSSIEPHQLVLHHQDESDSDVPGSRLASCIPNLRQGRGTAGTTVGDCFAAYDPPSLSKLLATASYEKAGTPTSSGNSRTGSSGSVEKVKVARTGLISCTNEPPTITQLLASNSTERTQETVPGSGRSIVNSEPEGTSGQQRTSRSIESQSRKLIRLDPSYKSSLTLLREEILKTPNSNSGPSREIPAEKLGKPSRSKLLNLQKIRAQMLSSRGKDSSSKQRRPGDEEQSVETSYSKSRETGSAKSKINMEQLKKIADKMRGKGSEPAAVSQYNTRAAPSGGHYSPLREQQTKSSISDNDEFVICDNKYTVIRDRKRSGDCDSLNCDIIPKKTLKTNLPESTIRTESSSYCTDILTETYNTTRQCLAQRRSLRQESFAGNAIELKRRRSTGGIVDTNMDNIIALYGSKPTSGVGVGSRSSSFGLSQNIKPSNSNVSVNSEKIEENSDVRQTNRHNHSNPCTSTMSSLRSARENKNLHFAKSPPGCHATEEQLTKPGGSRFETEAAGRAVGTPETVEREGSKQEEAVGNVMLDVGKGESATTTTKDREDVDTQVTDILLKGPFQPTISSDYYTEFSPLKYKDKSDDVETKICSVSDNRKSTKVNKGGNASTHGRPLNRDVERPVLEASVQPIQCSQGFNSVAAESQGFDPNMMTDTEPFVMPSGGDNDREKLVLPGDQSNNIMRKSANADVASGKTSHPNATQLPPESGAKSVETGNTGLRVPDIDSNKAQASSGGGYSMLNRHTTSTISRNHSGDAQTNKSKPTSLNDLTAIEQVDKDTNEPRNEVDGRTGENQEKPIDLSKNESKDEQKKRQDHGSQDPQVIFTSESWICQLDPNTGGRVYINRITGQTSTRKPRSTDVQPDPIQTKVRQSGACDDAVSSGWLADPTNQLHAGKSVRAARPTGTWNLENISKSTAYELFRQWENPMFKAPTNEPCYAVSDATQLSKRDVKVQTLIQPQRFTKEMLQTASVLKQVDNKFILCVMESTADTADRERKNKNVLVVIDQHAAHERVRLEQLTASLCNVDSILEKSSTDELLLEKSDIIPPLEVALSSDVTRVVKAFKNYIMLTGVDFTEAKGDPNKLLVSSIPACLLTKEIAQVKQKKTAATIQLIQDFLGEQAELLKQTSGSVSSLPPTLHNILCSQACHGAIRFGDPLTLAECKKIVTSLSTCSLPFQCAHGRPSCMPLLHLDSLETSRTKKTTRPNLWKLRQRMENEKLNL